MKALVKEVPTEFSLGVIGSIMSPEYRSMGPHEREPLQGERVHSDDDA